jgi:hypothetical protein
VLWSRRKSFLFVLGLMAVLLSAFMRPVPMPGIPGSEHTEAKASVSLNHGSHNPFEICDLGLLCLGAQLAPPQVAEPFALQPERVLAAHGTVSPEDVRPPPIG